MLFCYTVTINKYIKHHVFCIGKKYYFNLFTFKLRRKFFDGNLLLYTLTKHKYLILSRITTYFSNYESIHYF